MLRREYSPQHPPPSSSSPVSSSSSPVSSSSPQSLSSASSSQVSSSTTSSSAFPSSTVTASPLSASTHSPAVLLRRQRRRTSSLRHHPSASLTSRPCASGRPYQDYFHNCHHHHQPRQHHYRHHPKSTRTIAKNALNTANPALAHKLRQMALPLSPLVQLTTGAVHPHFPTNVLQFWLLTDAQLESLAIFYHQTAPVPGGRPSPWAAQYPCPVRWRSDAPLEEKRRRMGRFIGLRGCGESLPSPYPSPSPSPLPSPAHLHMHVDVDPMDVEPHVTTLKTEDEIARDARMARLAAAVDQDAFRRKTMAPGPGPWGR